VDPNSFFSFSDSDQELFCPFRIRILRLISWHDNFRKSGSHCVHMYSGTCKTEKKVKLWKKTYILISFKCETSDVSEQFLSYSSIWIRIRTFFSDSDLAKTFFRIRINNCTLSIWFYSHAVPFIWFCKILYLWYPNFISNNTRELYSTGT
jgi:hypothetical protein